MISIENNKKLCKDMPYLIPHDIYTGEIIEDYDYSYTEADLLPVGWRELFIQMCEDLKQPLVDAGMLNTFYFTQVKEKYNTMRTYRTLAPESIVDILNNYEYISQFICTKCGKPATKETRGYIASYCDDCLYDDDNTEKIIFNPIYRMIHWVRDNKYEETYDCTDIWDRYLKRINYNN